MLDTVIYAENIIKCTDVEPFLSMQVVVIQRKGFGRNFCALNNIFCIFSRLMSVVRQIYLKCVFFFS